MQEKGFRRSASGIFALSVLVTLLLFSHTARAGSPELDARHLVDKAKFSLETFMEAREMEAFRNLLKSARGLYIAPQVLRGAFIFGASGGSGVLIARDGAENKWIGPAFYTIGNVSFGLQIGGDASEIILLIMSQRGITAMLGTGMKLGADLSVALGPVGMGAQASTANLSADIIAFSRSKGLYGGISVDGAIVAVRESLNSAYYKKPTTPSDIFVVKEVTNPHADDLLNAAAKGAALQPQNP
jgi:lipid-binding SYLF domain-containing protein